jgi:hypothetical protein
MLKRAIQKKGELANTQDFGAALSHHAPPINAPSSAPASSPINGRPM